MTDANKSALPCLCEDFLDNENPNFMEENNIPCYYPRCVIQENEEAEGEGWNCLTQTK